MNVDFDILISLIMPVLIHPGVGGGLNKWLLRGDAFWTWASPLTSMTSLRQLFPQSFGKLADDMRELDGSYLTQTSGTVWTLEPGGEQIWPKFGPIPHTCYLSQSLEQPTYRTHISNTQSPFWSTGPKFMCDKSWMGHLLAIKFKLTLWLLLCVRKKTRAQKYQKRKGAKTIWGRDGWDKFQAWIRDCSETNFEMSECHKGSVWGRWYCK